MEMNRMRILFAFLSGVVAITSDIDECHENTRNCKSKEECENRIGFYRCTDCKPGYLLNRKKRCIDINECTQNSHNCYSGSRRHCKNKRGYYRCKRCKPGYHLNSTRQCTESHCEELKRCSPEPIPFPTKRQLEERCTPPLFTDAEWCWLSNYHTCEDEPIKSNLAAERRIRKLHCQLKDDLKNENLLERVFESECNKNSQKMEKLITDMEAFARQYKEKLHALEQEPMSDRDGQICRIFEDVIHNIYRESLKNCGEAVGVYVSKFFLSRYISIKKRYKCLHYDVIKIIVGRSEGCEALYHCWNTTQFGTVLNNLRNQTQINIFCSQKGHRMINCWNNYEGQCESMWRRMVEEELNQMQLICLPDFKDVASIMSNSALVSVATTVLDCEENFLQIYPGLLHNREDLKYLEKVSCRNIDHVTECIKKGVYVGLRQISITHLDVLYSQARSIALKRQLPKLFSRCHNSIIILYEQYSSIDECHGNARNCKSIEKCDNRIGFYLCTACKSGYRLNKKKHCIDIDECTQNSHNCYSGSGRHCKNKRGHYQCKRCKPGYHLNSKRQCIDKNECKEKRHNCRSRRLCRNLPGTYKCKRCKKGFRFNSTKHCIDRDECQENSHNCSSKIRCVNVPGSFYCKCKDGYRLEDDFSCSEINECRGKRHNCRSRRHCRNLPGTYKCKCCKRGYQLNSTNHCIDRDECQENSHNCSSKIRCVNVPGSFYCKCKDGYRLEDDFSCSEINECRGKRHNCRSRRHCRNLPGTYKCKRCKRGYQLNSTNHCIDRDECQENSHNCSSEIRCVNVPGSFYCKCKDGYRLEDNFVCSDKDECTENSDICGPNSRCKNMLGTFLCECKDGYSKASSLNCADINECKGNTDGKRHNCSSSTKCDNLPGSFRCECHDGYIQVDSFTCKDIDECQKNNVQTLHNCTFNTACENLPGSFRCTCPDGYRLTDKLYCRDIDECKENTDGKRRNCSSISKCQNLLGSYRCECYDGYIQVDSFTCKDIDECQINNCQTLHNCTFNTVCENLPGSFRCTCPDGYRLMDKLYCRDIDECLYEGEPHAHKCGAHTYCINTDGGYKCQCLSSGFKRVDDFYCKDIDECMQHLCGVNTRCENFVGSFSCACLPGYAHDDDFRSCPLGEECLRCGDNSLCTSYIGISACACKDARPGACIWDPDDCTAITPPSSCHPLCERWMCLCKPGYDLDLTITTQHVCKAFCPDTWINFQSIRRYCIKVYDDMLSWPDARKVCQTQGGDLMNFGEFREYDMFKEIKDQFEYDDYWILLKDVPGRGTAIWVNDMHLMDYNHEDRRVSTKPHGFQNSQCGSMHPGTGIKFHFTPCHYKKRFVCQLWGGPRVRH